MKKSPERHPTRRSHRIANKFARLDINKLAPEIFDSIIAQLDNESLQKARLVNRIWRAPATDHLFRTIALLPTRDGLKNWKRINKHKILRDLPRKAIVYSAPVPRFQSWVDWSESEPCAESLEWTREYAIMYDWQPNPRARRYKSFYSEVDSLSKMPNLQDAYLHFTPSCGTEDYDFLLEGTETSEFRIDFLNRFFRALKNRQNTPEFSRVRKLTINNLQNQATPEFTSSALFKEVMQDVKHLKLMVTQESTDLIEQENGTKDVYHLERRTFMPYLEAQWLRPWSQLKSLALYFHEPWGPLPGHFHGKSLEFPLLETLMLGRYCLGHNDSLDWVLRQTSIKSLRFQNCVMLSYIMLEKTDIESWNVSTHDWIPFPYNLSPFEEVPHSYYDKFASFHFPGTWEEAFDRIRTRLVNLTDFRLHFNVIPPYHYENMLHATFDTPERQTTSLSPGRYMGFDLVDLYPWTTIMNDGCMMWGDDPEESEWEEYDTALSEGREYTGTRVLNRHTLTKEGDDRALNDLLKTITDRSRA